jgi:hypothetical protein
MDKRLDEVIAGFPFPDLNWRQTERLILGEIQPEQYLSMLISADERLIFNFLQMQDDVRWETEKREC